MDVMVITSKDNETIKHIKKLKEKKYRDEYKEFIVEGIKMVQEAIEEKADIKSIIICDDCSKMLLGMNQNIIQHLIETIR